MTQEPPPPSRQPPSSTDRARGTYTPTPLNTLLFIFLRFLNLPLQYYILTLPAASPTKNPIPSSPIFPNPPSTNLIRLPYFPPVTPHQLAILSCCLLTALKHSLWIAHLRHETITLPLVIFGALGNTLYNALDSWVFTLSYTDANPFFSSAQLWAGVAIHHAAVLAEVHAEMGRKRFKDGKGSKGKLYAGGLFGYARNLNYTCNIVFGFGHGMAAGGWPMGLFMGGLYVGNFVWNAIPPLEGYLGGKYGAQWDRFCGRVPWRLVPGVY